METISTFLGRFHPLVVHLPIGILILSFMMEGLSRWQKYAALDKAVPFALLVGSGSAALAAALGYLLSWSGDYDPDTLWWHQYLGIGVAVLGFGCYWLKQRANKNLALGAQGLLLVMLSIAGHLGGNLTHGATYLTEYAPWTPKKEKLPPPEHLDSAFVFQHLIQPLLEKKCQSCHNAGKRKGQLRMDSPEQLLKGGKHGAILVAGNSAKSEMYRRVTLSPEDEEFMPTDGKTPLTEEEMQLLEWWIGQTEHTFTQKLAEVAVSEDIRMLVAKQLDLEGNQKAIASLPGVPVEVIDRLTQSGFVVRSLQGDFEYLDVSLKEIPANVKGTNLDRLLMLEEIADRVIWLNLSGQEIKDEDLSALRNMENLQRLRLDNNPLTNAGLSFLSILEKLESINLYNTEIDQRALAKLAQFPALKKVYLWRTNIEKEVVDKFQLEYPEKELVFGVEG